MLACLPAAIPCLSLVFVPAIVNLLAVIVHLKPTGGAPVLKVLKFKVRNFADVHPRERPSSRMTSLTGCRFQETGSWQL